MKSIRWTPHATQEATRREISANEAEKTVTHPDSVAPAQLQRRIFMRRYFDSVLQTEMLLRVVVEETEAESVVVTPFTKLQSSRNMKGGRNNED